MGRPKLTDEERIEKRRAYQREYYKKKYHENLEKAREKSRENAKKWREKNPEKEHIIKLRYHQKAIDSHALNELNKQLQALRSLTQYVSPSARDEFIRTINSAVDFLEEAVTEDDTKEGNNE